MNEVWNLDPIYKGFDDPAFEADLASAKEEIEKAKESSRQILSDARKEADALSKKIVKSAEETAQNKDRKSVV